jgi:hypothetical protein
LAGEFSAPQPGQACICGVPQLGQNRCPGAISAPHDAHGVKP